MSGYSARAQLGDLGHLLTHGTADISAGDVLTLRQVADNRQGSLYSSSSCVPSVVCVLFSGYRIATLVGGIDRYRALPPRESQSATHVALVDIGALCFA